MAAIHRIAAGAVATGIVLALAGTACAQAPYPGKPVRLIVPYAPGGGTSVMSRLVVQKLSEKGLAVTGSNRLAAVPQLPTFSEAGLPGFNLTNWNGVLAPADIAKAVVDRIAADIARVMQMPEVREQLVAQGQNAWATGPGEFAALIRSEIDTFARVVKAAGITIN